MENGSVCPRLLSLLSCLSLSEVACMPELGLLAVIAWWNAGWSYIGVGGRKQDYDYRQKLLCLYVFGKFLGLLFFRFVSSSLGVPIGCQTSETMMQLWRLLSCLCLSEVACISDVIWNTEHAQLEVCYVCVSLKMRGCVAPRWLPLCVCLSVCDCSGQQTR